MTRTLATKRDIRPEELVEVGLASPRQSGRGGVYDKFRARVIFPIRDQNGHAVGLGGRLLEGDGPKYLNSPATPLFDKSRTLYLIDKAKGPIRKSGPGRHRRGLHRRADGASGRLRQRRRQPRHRADARPGRAADPLRDADRARLRRRPGRREGRHARRDRAGRPDRQLQRTRPGSSSRTSGSPGCPTARIPTRSSASRRPSGRPRSPRPSRSSSTSSTITPAGSTSRPRPAGSASSRRSCRPSATSPTRSGATRRSARSGASRASRSGSCARSWSARRAIRSRRERPGAAATTGSRG